MAMPAIRRRWTTAEVRALTDESRAWPRYELIDGELLVTPAPTWSHQAAVLRLAILLDEYVTRESVGTVLTSPSDLQLQNETITQPDVFVVPADIEPSGPAMQWPDVRTLLLAVEVLSPSSLRVDRVVKRDFYMTAGVEEYWIVDLDARIIERWAPSQETPRIARDQLEWTPRGASTPLLVNVAALFERVRLASKMTRP